ncbi:cellulose synthase subunit BcsC-related outer membrane protein, partial [Sphingobium sp.]|uniref:cellulose synthase subunit BcsC-related outer membrane protein n=1 Tax=Sphingobium sp. TaxID=1912891 RepID=UPI002C6E8756
DSEASRYLKTAKTLYMRQSGIAPGAVMPNGNPFAAAPQSANPFRAAAAPQPVNPFALSGNASAISAPYAPPVGFARPQTANPGFAMSGSTAESTYGSFVGDGYSTAGNRPAPAIGNYAAPNAMPGTMNDMASVTQAYPYAGNGPSDPVLAEIDQQLQSAANESGPRVDVDTGYRSRSGETDLSKLREMTGSAQLSTNVGGGRAGIKATAVVLDSGRPTGSGLARFGTNATPEAQAIVDELASVLTNAETQHESGVAITASYVSNLLRVEAGTTPLGFEKEHITGKIEATPRLSQYASVRVWADRKPVTDSIIAYAGTTDPRSNSFWGAVMKSGGGLSLSYDRNGNGVYADGSYYHYDGTAVRDNDSIEINAGGYLRAWQNAHSGVSVGFNVNYQNYDNNQNYFTYGHGGYFSPQSFLSVNFPIRYWSNNGPMSIQASVAPGYQSYDQQGEPVYPTEAGAQAVLDYLKSQNGDVRSAYDSISKTGFGLSANGTIFYQVSPNTKVGGELNINTFGQYKEFKTLIGLKQAIGGN